MKFFICISLFIFIQLEFVSWTSNFLTVKLEIPISLKIASDWRWNFNGKQKHSEDRAR